MQNKNISLCEQWLVCKHDSRYLISNYGRIKSLCSGKERMLAPTENSGGYLYVTLNRKKYYIHRLVAEHFIQDNIEKYQVHHIDRNQKNNNVNNLVVLSAKEHRELHKLEKAIKGGVI